MTYKMSPILNEFESKLPNITGIKCPYKKGNFNDATWAIITRVVSLAKTSPSAIYKGTVCSLIAKETGDVIQIPLNRHSPKKGHKFEMAVKKLIFFFLQT
jgi:hypothetical protein